MSESLPTVSDTKRAFYRGFPKPVNSVYRRAIDELLVESHLLTVCQTFHYDPIFALGWVTAFDEFTTGYRPEADRAKIYHALVSALRLDAEQLRADAQQLAQIAQSAPQGVVTLLTTGEGSPELEPLTGTVHRIAGTPQFKYSRLLAIGLFRLLALSAPEQWADPERRKALLAQVGKTLNLNSEKLIRDQELYQSSLDKLKQSLQMMADLVEAERKKRQKHLPTPSTVSSQA